MSPLRLAVVGAGRMGAAVAEEAGRRGHRVTAMIGRGELDAAAIEETDAVIEFTRGEAAPAVTERLLERGGRVVSGTTGWTPDRARIEALVERHRGAFLHAANFSVGFQLLRRAAAALASGLAGLDRFDAAIREEHHRHKVDAPSGSALVLRADLATIEPGRSWPIASERRGSVPGTHSVLIDGDHESVTLTHTVRNRAVFAAGAVLAAEFLAGRTGLFTFDDVLTGATR